MNWDYGMAALFVAGFVVLYILMWTFIKPVKLMLKVLLNSVIGTLLLVLFNTIGSVWAFSVPVNIYTALTCGILGVPGFILILLVKWIYGI